MIPGRPYLDPSDPQTMLTYQGSLDRTAERLVGKKEYVPKHEKVSDERKAKHGPKERPATAESRWEQRRRCVTCGYKADLYPERTCGPNGTCINIQPDA